MITCPQCQAPNKPTARFCQRCGAALAQPAAQRKTYTPLQPGQLLHGTYRVVRQLGRGGMGAVYLATQTIAGRQRNVVVKEMLDYVARRDYPSEAAYQQACAKARQRFEAEAATLVDLSHTGIPAIFDFFSEGGSNYIVMEFIAGSDLAQGLTRVDDMGKTVKGHPYPWQQVVQWGIALCRVLDYLARRQPPVVHHDIKPSNMILDANTGEPRLVDFGTAKASALARTGFMPEVGPGRQQSSIYGTAGYAAPEMYQGQSSPRTDVYALAATLYHLLTDDDPRQHPLSFPNLDQLPAPLAQVLRDALAPNPQERPAAHDFQCGLESVLQPSVSATTADAGGAPRWLGWLAGGIVAAALLIWGLVWGRDLIFPETTPVQDISRSEATATVFPATTAPPSPENTPDGVVEAGNVYVEYILDASSGMLSPWAGEQETRLESAKRALFEHWQRLDPATGVGFRVYGHRLHATDAATCADVELISAPQHGDLQALVDVLEGVQAQGKDSLAEALRQAFGDFEFMPGRTNALVVISDGGDTCGGDPLLVLQSQRDTGVALPVYVVGLDVEASQAAVLKQIAELSGGRYYDVTGIEALHTALTGLAQVLSE